MMVICHPGFYYKNELNIYSMSLRESADPKHPGIYEAKELKNNIKIVRLL